MNNDKIYYLYRHIRLDKNEPFYIGVSSIKSDNNSGYARANRVSNRNHIWNNIYKASSCQIDIEIIYETDSKDEIFKKENEFVLLYGRKNNNTGCLANLTDGGLGAVGAIYTEERRTKQSKSMKNSPFSLKGKKLPDWWRDKIRQTKFGKDNPQYGKHTPASKKVINVETKEVFDTILLAGESIGLKGRLLHQYLSGHRVNKSPFVYLNIYNELGEEKCLKLINNKPKANCGNGKVVVDINTGVEYGNAKIASKSVGYNETYLRRMLSGAKINRTTLKYKND